MMTAEHMINRYNQSLILGNHLTEFEKQQMIRSIRSHIHVNSLVVMDSSLSYMHPMTVDVDYEAFGRLRLFNGYLPKTKILYSNYIELELLSILYQLDKTSNRGMYELVKKRLKTTCFGRFCETGECFEISLAAMRFLQTVFPEEREWIQTYRTNISGIISQGQKRVAYQTKLMYAWTLYMTNTEEAYGALLEMTDWLSGMVGRFRRPKDTYDYVNRAIVYFTVRKSTPMQLRLS